MARISRKKKVVEEKGIASTGKVYRTAIYVRLSYEDERKIEQDSVENQKKLLRDFVSSQSDLEIAGEYIDRGESGTSFDRPEFKQMMEDIKAGKLDCIAVKDLSRLGRNYLETGDYIEKIFPFLGIRFIAVTDHYDSLTSEPGEDGLIVPLKNLINEAYAKDISRKIRSAIDNMYRDGTMVASSIAYGYLRDPDRDHQIIIDDVAAPIVRRIFREYVDGNSTVGIARGLNADNIAPPSVRRIETGARKTRKYENCRWVSKTVGYILKNPIYTGDLEMGVRKTSLIQGKKAEIQKKEDRYLVHDHHEPIISREMFQKAQNRLEAVLANRALQSTVPEELRNNREAVLAGLIYCGDCRRGMHFHRRTRQYINQITYKAAYECPRSITYGPADPNKSLNADTVEDVIKTLIELHIKVFQSTEGAIKTINRTPAAAERRRALNRQLHELQGRKEKISRILQELYSDYSEQLFSEDEYQEMKKEYLNELAVVEGNVQSAEAELKTFQENYSGPSESHAACRKYAGFEKLTNEIARTFIQRIYCYADGRIEVEYMFQNEFLTLLSLIEERRGRSEG